MTSVRPPTPSRLAAPVAHAILEAFAAHRVAFLDVTRRAKTSFERRDWAALRADSVRRLGMYRDAVSMAEEQIRELLGERDRNRLVWVSAKAVYSALIAERQDWDLAETFFNGVTRRIFDTVGVDPLIEFVASDFDGPPVEPEELIYRRYVLSEDVDPTSAPIKRVARVIAAILHDHGFDVPYADPEGDALSVAERVETRLVRAERGGAVAIEVIEAPFFRGKASYLVGRIVVSAGVVIPLVLALRNGPDGVRVDAVLLEAGDVSMLFSFTRSYFHVAVARPYDVMRFLRSLIPKKRIAELYIAIGEPKQGKTELYRAMMDHIDETKELFGYAPGVPGLVMVVFTMPGLDVVLKVIRDRFPPEKDTSAEKVRERYSWVYAHDRAGRLVDAQEFEHLAFSKDRFEPEVLKELLEECSETVRLEKDRVIVELAYVERQLVPLNLYIRQREPEDAARALAEWGQAIADLAAEGIFPGDLLLKNFGVTAQRRVALYDYDELVPLTEVCFRNLPEARFDEDEMRPEPWYAVGPHDVFPEELNRFLAVPRHLRPVLEESCAHVFDPAWWRAVQEQVRRGKIVEHRPYPRDRRLSIAR